MSTDGTQDASSAKKQKVVRYICDDELNNLLAIFAANLDDCADDLVLLAAEDALVSFAKQRDVVESVDDEPPSRSAAPPPDAPQDQPTPEDTCEDLSLKETLIHFLKVAEPNILNDVIIFDANGQIKKRGVQVDRDELLKWVPYGHVFLSFSNEKLWILSDTESWTKEKMNGMLAKNDSLTIVDTLNALSILAQPENGVASYIKGLVNTVPEDYENMLILPPDRTKGAALVVAGESGSGKSWFVQHTLRNAVISEEKSVFLYHCLADTDLTAHCPYPELEDADKEVAVVLGKAMRVLQDRGANVRGKVYDMLSQRNLSLHKTRNGWAQKLLYKIIEQKCSDKPSLSEWWSGRSKGSVKRLVLTLDEAGKNLDLARGLVDGARCIYADLAKRDVAPTVMLCVSGSGLERVFDIDYSHPGTNPMAALGTDAVKSNVIVLTKPSIDKLPETRIQRAIQKGTYSRILSTNTRMLTRGIMPILNEQKFLFEVSKCRMDQRLVDLGSTNIVMDYAARVYFKLNGLANISQEGRDKVLLQAFQYLMVEFARKGIELNPVSEETCKKWALGAQGLNQILSKGLVAADAVNTSNALRYLACDGQTFPLIPADGMSLEIVLQLHLCRLQKVMSYDSMPYDLLEAWPPKSTKGSILLADKGVTEDELEARYSGHAFVDIAALSRMIKSKVLPTPIIVEDAAVKAPSTRPMPDVEWGKNTDKPKTTVVVMRQTNATAQGPDVMVLSIGHINSLITTATLDLYQAKNCSVPFGFDTNKLRESVQSLGISISDVNGDDLHPNTGSAGYSYLGIKYFANCLTKELGVSVEIHSRVLVVSWSLGQMTWTAADFKKAKEGGLTVWTKEQMEPTISALVLAPAAVLPDINIGISEMSWEKIMSK